MITGQLLIDVPVYSDDPSDIEQGMDPTVRGIDISPADFIQDPADPSVYRSHKDFQGGEIVVTITVSKNGTISVVVTPGCEIVKNTLRI